MAKPVQEIIEMVSSSQFSREGQKRVQCGLSGESLPICNSCDKDGDISAQMDLLRPILAAPEHRRWHVRWHQREGDGFTRIKGKERSDMKAMGAINPGESRREVNFRVRQNPGENFFFMHRQMIKMTQIELAYNGLPCIAPWDRVPRRWNDRQWPTPKGRGQQEDLDDIHEAIRQIDNKEYLRSVGLSELGNQINTSFHGLLHFAYQGTPEEENSKCISGDTNINSPTCDALIHPQTSHVNPHFWKLHGYIDSFVGKWLNANGYSEISLSCSPGDSSCYQWKGTFAGDFPNQN